MSRAVSSPRSQVDCVRSLRDPSSPSTLVYRCCRWAFRVRPVLRYTPRILIVLFGIILLAPRVSPCSNAFLVKWISLDFLGLNLELCFLAQSSHLV
jgi:hypothetical protein